MVKEMLNFAFDENDDADQVRIKGHKLSIYCLDLIIKECRLDNPNL